MEKLEFRQQEILSENKALQNQARQKDAKLLEQDQQFSQVSKKVEEFSVLMEKLIKENQQLRLRGSWGKEQGRLKDLELGNTSKIFGQR